MDYRPGPCRALAVQQDTEWAGSHLPHPPGPTVQGGRQKIHPRWKEFPLEQSGTESHGIGELSPNSPGDYIINVQLNSYNEVMNLELPCATLKIIMIIFFLVQNIINDKVEKSYSKLNNGKYSDSYALVSLSLFIYIHICISSSSLA